MFIFLIFNPLIISADSVIRISSYSATSNFPSGLRFNIQVESDEIIEEIAVRMKFGQQKSGVYEYFEFDSSNTVIAELFWNTNTSGKYVPPGTIVSYSFEVTTSKGNKINSEETEMIFHDSRFEWKEVSVDLISVAYHGPVGNMATEILDAIIETTTIMSPIVGDLAREPIRVTIYNNVKEMLPALPPGSETIRRELITEGQAFVDFGTLLILAGGSGALGTAAHEVTHILVHRAGDSVYRRIPSWLDEGLAEYANKNPAFGYDMALDLAVQTNTLLPITTMPTMPGTPEDIILYYGQSKSIVEYLIDVYGTDKMQDLLGTMKAGKNVDESFQIIYKKTKEDIENEWRSSIGASLYEWNEEYESLPTPIPRPEVKIFSLTPQAGGTILESTNIQVITDDSEISENQIDNKNDSRNCAISSDSNSTDISSFFVLLFVNILKSRSIPKLTRYKKSGKYIGKNE
jgi:hypothetical protein